MKEIIEMAVLRDNKFKIAAVTLFSMVMAVLIRIYSVLDIWTETVRKGTGLTGLVKLVFANPSVYAVFVCIFLILAILFFNKKIRDFIYKYRFALAGGIFVLCIILEISGSSIGRWCDMFDTADGDVLIGISRSIRSDEYCLATPYFFSQKMSESPDAFSYFSDYANGYESDLFMGIRQPVQHILTVFRPFTLGFLFLSPAKGLSFWWCGKLIVLFLATFEMGMLLSDRRKSISFIMASLVTFAPVVQWWFSTGISELIIYTEISMLMFNKYLTARKYPVRLALLAGILYIAGCFIMLLYPSWQVPFVFIILVLTVWLIIRNRPAVTLRWYDYISIAAGLMGLAAVFLYIFNKSSETMALISGTVYPGERLETGGGKLSYMFTYPVNTWFALTNFGFGPNICESATIIDFFPLSVILPVAAMIKNRKKDLLSLMLLGLNLFFFIWIAFGFPEIIAKVTFMSNSQAVRTMLAFGFVNIMLLVRGIYLLRCSFKKRTAVLVSGVISVAVMLIACYVTKGDYLAVTGKKIYLGLLGITLVLMFSAMFSFMMYGKKKGRILSVMFVIITAFVGGVMVNPVRKGVDSVYSVPWVKEICEVSENEGGSDIWAVECNGLESPVFANVGLLCGVKTFNATAVYPNLELWETLDSEGKYSDVYNRYAHIGIIVKESGEPEFELITADSFRLYITLDDLHKAGVKYITGLNDLSGYTAESDCSLVRLDSGNGIYIYRIE